VSVTVRAAAPADLPAIDAVERAVFGPVVYPAFFFRQAMDLWPGLLLVAERGPGDLAGYVLAAPAREPGVGWIVSVAVRAELRSRGIGGRLTAAAVEALTAAGCAKLRLTVHPDNRAAIGTYERLGFVPGEVDPGHFGPGEPRLFMTRDVAVGA
jgi:[ribosomal protein S18]-alanine N-acetyltransferase